MLVPFCCLVRREEERIQPHRVDGRLAKRLGDDSGLSELDSEANMNHWVQSTCNACGICHLRNHIGQERLASI